jgi:hypothetical protein
LGVDGVVESLVVEQLGGLHGGAVRAGWAGRLMPVRRTDGSEHPIVG